LGERDSVGAEGKRRFGIKKKPSMDKKKAEFLKTRKNF